MSKLLKVRSAREYSNNWVSVVLSAISLLLLILAGAGVITSEQQGALAPILSDTVQAVSVIVAGVIQVIKIVFKPVAEPTV